MQYIEYNLKFFDERLKYFEKLDKKNKLKYKDIHEAQMLLKEILDLKDQGQKKQML